MSFSPGNQHFYLIWFDPGPILINYPAWVQWFGLCWYSKLWVFAFEMPIDVCCIKLIFYLLALEIKNLQVMQFAFVMLWHCCKVSLHNKHVFVHFLPWLLECFSITMSLKFIALIKITWIKYLYDFWLGCNIRIYSSLQLCDQGWFRVIKSGHLSSLLHLRPILRDGVLAGEL